MNKEEINKLVKDIKKKIVKSREAGKLDVALQLIELAGIVLYTTNQAYSDPELEEETRLLQKKILDVGDKCDLSSRDNSSILFYDAVGLSRRGLTYIYVNSLLKFSKLHYVTFRKNEERAKEIIELVKSNGGTVDFLPSELESRSVVEMSDLIEKYNSKHLFFYAYSFDVVGLMNMYAYENKCLRYQINLTDHGFNLGVDAFDKNINFREYGACIDKFYRNIPEEKIVLLPMYPCINEDIEFQGFPFDNNDNFKLIFSGGALYKTLGDGDIYYDIVRFILDTDKSTIFWYAGSGDSTKMKALMKEYPGRVYLTKERPDLFQILKRCYFYLNTFPMCGGLMYQYAACAGKLPITLRKDAINDSFLIHQSELGVDYDTLDALKAEIKKILQDSDLCAKKSSLMCDAVIKEHMHIEELQNIVNGRSTYAIDFKPIDTSKFIATYMERLKSKNVNYLLMRKSYCGLIIRKFPIRAMILAFCIAKDKLMKCFFNK